MAEFRQSLNDQMRQQKMVDDLLTEIEREADNYVATMAVDEMTDEQIRDFFATRREEYDKEKEEQKMVNEGLEELEKQEKKEKEELKKKMKGFTSEAIDLSEERSRLPNSLYGFAQTLTPQQGLEEIDEFFK